MAKTQRSNEEAIETYEARFARWQQGYQRYQQVLGDFRRSQAGFGHQMALWREHHHSLQDMREDLKREVQEMEYRRRRQWGPR